MTKDEVKTICETDERLQWWAMVLFAEISDMLHHVPPRERDAAVMNVIAIKVDEFPKLVVQRKLEEAKARPSLEERVAALEAASKASPS